MNGFMPRGSCYLGAQKGQRENEKIADQRPKQAVVAVICNDRFDIHDIKCYMMITLNKEDGASANILCLKGVCFLYV